MKPISDNKISLARDTHQYVLESQPALEFTSVTTVLGSYFEPFDEVAIATNLCTTNHKYIGMDPADLISEWRFARDHGTKVHDEIELFLTDGVQPSAQKAKIALEWLEKYRLKSEIEIHTEVIVYSTELQVAGTIDILAHDKTADAYEIIDWKTGKKIESVSFRGKMGLDPITSNLMDCNFNHYAMQLSFYRYLLEKYYGVTVHNQMIAHLQDEKCSSYITPYYDQEISAIAAELIERN